MPRLYAKKHGAVLLPKITGLDFTLGVTTNDAALGAPGAISALGSKGLSDSFADLSAGIRLDLTVSETATTGAAVTPFPVEQGAEVTDHVIPTSRTYSISGVQGDFERFAEEADPGRAAALFNRLDLAVVSGELFTLVTDVRVYENVVIISLSGTKSQGVGFALPMQIQVQEVRFATSEEVFIPAPKKRLGRASAAGAGSEKDKNRRGGKTPPTPDFLSSSVLFDMGAQNGAGGAARALGFQGTIVDLGTGIL